jgi:hypothetical protein
MSFETCEFCPNFVYLNTRIYSSQFGGGNDFSLAARSDTLHLRLVAPYPIAIYNNYGIANRKICEDRKILMHFFTSCLGTNKLIPRTDM